MRKIAIVGGGNSSEFDISMKSARAVMEALSDKYETYLINFKGLDWYWEDNTGRAIPVNKDNFTLKHQDRIIRFDAVFIAIHGTPGENGLLQGYLDMIGIPYTSCDTFCASLTFNKHACKVFLNDYGISMPNSVKITSGKDYNISGIIEKTGLPCFVKPNASGSSFGVSRVDKIEKLDEAIVEAFKESNDVLIEAYLEGREVGCGVFKSSRKEHVLPVTEIITDNTFFDFEAKYVPGKADEITPANLPEELYAKVQDLSSRIYDLLSCKGVVRVDFIIVDEEPYFLEINSVPGMTKESIIPKQIDAYGTTPSLFYSEVVESLF